MPKAATKKKKANGKRPIQPYEHSGKQRINNPPVGLVTPQTDPDLPTHKTYYYVQTVPSPAPASRLRPPPPSPARLGGQKGAQLL